MLAYTYETPHGYPDDMARGKRGPGPWGAALEYWLDKYGWSQAHLVSVIRKQEEAERKLHPAPPRPPTKTKDGKTRKRRVKKEMQLNTVSRAYRGLHTNTFQLARMAKGLNVSLEEILISPAHRMQDEAMRQHIAEVVYGVMRQLDTERVPARPPVPPITDAEALIAPLSRAVEATVEHLEDKERARTTALTKKSSGKRRRERKGG
ncbi:MAG TPA: hypothetical protein VKD28_04735 [Gemmatimonadales bacterium]|nr:hypothetical protein [Gemmatimonadales bacterium]